MNATAPFAPELSPLLVPVPGDLPAGPSLRYDLAYLAIRTAREEEDAKLPMREWERPLKKADWRLVETHATSILATRSKDFQVAAWLCESWVHQYQIAGLVAAVRLLIGMVEQYWDSGHPQIEAEDDEARVAPFFWLNENLPRLLMLHISLMHLPERMPSAVTVFDWEQALALENRKPEGKKGTAAPKISPVPTRSEIVAGANGVHLQSLWCVQSELLTAQTLWDSLIKSIDIRMGMQSPSLAKVSDMLVRMSRTCATLIDRRKPPPPPSVVTPVVAKSPTEPVDSSTQTLAPDGLPATSLNTLESESAMGPITSRDDAYRALEAVASYLERTEPHSPTPFLIRRAVHWGRMSLPDLMQEVIREEGDVSRFFSLLGVSPPGR